MKCCLQKQNETKKRSNNEPCSTKICFIIDKKQNEDKKQVRIGALQNRIISFFTPGNSLQNRSIKRFFHNRCRKLSVKKKQ